MAGPCQGRSFFLGGEKNLKLQRVMSRKRSEEAEAVKEKETELDTLPRTDLTLSLTTHICPYPLGTAENRRRVVPSSAGAGSVNLRVPVTRFLLDRVCVFGRGMV